MKMISLYESLLTVFEAVVEKYILKTPKDAFDFFGVEPNSKEGQLITYMYSIAPDNPDTETGYSSPFVGGYGSKTGFACRRWVKDNPSLIEYMEKNKINFTTAFKGHSFKDYHDTKLEKIDSFPSSADEEIFIAMSLNIKSIGSDNSEKAMKYALFGDENKELSNKEKEIYNKFYKYYEGHKKSIDERAKDFDLEEGELFTKCSNSSVKKDIQSSWMEDGNYSKYPDYTPKTDIISNKGRKCSIKKSTGAQAMSGGMNETAATLMTYSYLLDEETQKKIDSLFKDENGKLIDWNGRDDERNEKLNNTIKEIFKNKEANKKFIMAVLTESLTGAGKFGENSDGTSNEMITWSKDGKLIKDDIESYIYRTYENISEKSITINHKSSGKTWTVMRLYLPKHYESYKPLTDEEKKNNKELLDVIKSVRENESLKSRKSEEEIEKDVEITDDSGKKVKVSIKTGPRGGKYYYPDGKPKTPEHKVYVEKGSNGYIIKKD